jgi:predicted MFS family arabinose efflux permease
VTLAVYLAGIGAAANRFKVPPVLDTLMADRQVDMATGGWFMSVFSIAGLALAIPAAILLTRLGLRATGLIAVGCTVVGAVIGAIAPGITGLLVGRVIGGVSVGLLAVVAPAAISLWFEPRERGMPMGVWATWVPVGNVIMFNAAHPLMAACGWRAVWWFGALLALVAFLVCALVVATPPGRSMRVDGSTQQEIGSLNRMLLNPTSWLLGLAFGLFGFSMLGYNTWAPSYLTETLRIDPATASFYASLMFVAGIPGSLVAGWAINRTQRRYALLTASLLVTGIILAGSFHLGSVRVVAPYMILLGFVSNFVPPTLFTLAPETMRILRFASLGLAVTIVGGNAGAMTEPPILGSVLSGGSWSSGSVVLVAAMRGGLIASLLAWRRMRTR